MGNLRLALKKRVLFFLALPVLIMIINMVLWEYLLEAMLLSHARYATAYIEDEHFYEVLVATFLILVSLIIPAWIILKTDIRLAIKEEDEKAAREYSRNLIDSSLDMIISVDRNREIVEFNRAAEETFGYSRDEVLGRSVTLLFAYPSEAEKSHQKIDNEGQFTFEVLNRRKNGEVFTSFLRATRINDNSGNIIGTMGISRDITEQKRAERIIRESHERLLAVFESLDAFVWVADMETYEIVYANSAMEKALGGIRGNACYEIMHTEQSSPCRFCRKDELLHIDDRPGKVHIWETYNSKNGRYYESRSRVIRWVDRSMVMLEIATDITDRKKMEAGLQVAKEEAERANELKDKFVSLVSHDLQGPLSTILGYLKLIRDDVGEPANEGATAILNSAIDAGVGMVNLIDELLSISRVRSGKVSLKLGVQDAYLVGLKVIANHSSSAERKGIKLLNKIPKNTRLFTDAVLHFEVIDNLVSNAIKFCNRGDVINVYIPENSTTTIAVADSGVGIEGKKLHDLFNYEVKTSGTGTDGEKGNGFGLPLSHEIMELLGGTLKVESSLGKGSVFYARLPFAKPVILLVDDHKPTRSLYKTYLKELGADVIEAADGKDAMKVIAETIPHLVVTNLNMPHMDGFELLENIKGDKRTESIPVFMLTGDSSKKTEQKALSLGVDHFAHKSVANDALTSRIRKLIG